MGRVLGDDSTVESTPGDTLVTSIDAKVQSAVEKALAERIKVQRATFDPVTGRNYAADSGAAVVLEARTGRVVAMASQPTYDPGVWVGGISTGELDRLYSEQAGTPLLSRATQGQFAPGSTWKPIMTAGALTNGYRTDSTLTCPSGVQIGNRVFHNHESSAIGGAVGFAKALEVSCNTFFYQIGYRYWQKFGSDEADVDARDPLVEEAKTFGFGSRTGIDIPGEAPGRIADRHWKRDYYDSMKDYYCGIADKPQDGKTSDFVYQFSREFCIDGYAYRAGDAANFAIGQGDTIVTPLQLARAYAAHRQRRHALRPDLAKALVSPDGEVLQRFNPPAYRLGARAQEGPRLHRRGAQGRHPGRHDGLEDGRLPARRRRVRSKTGSAEVYGKQSTGWVASYTDDYVVVMMISQAGTGSGIGRRRRPQGLGGALRRGRRDGQARATPPSPASSPRRSSRPSSTTARSCRRPSPGAGGLLVRPTHAPTGRPALRAPGPRLAADGGRARPGRHRHPARLVGDLDPRRPHRRRPHGVPAQAARQRRHRPGADGDGARHRPPVGADPGAAGLPRLVVGLVGVLVAGSTINGSRSWIQLGGMSIQPSEFAKLAVVIGMALLWPSAAKGGGAAASRRPRCWACSLIAGVPAALILLQPDLGTMLVLSATVFGVLAVAGAARRWLVGLTLVGVGGAAVAVAAGVLKDYQVDRFMAFTNPGLDPRGAGYNTEQARIAVGNGGLFGQGLFDGLPDPLGLRARAAHRLHLHRRRRGARPGRRRPAHRPARRRDLAGAGHRDATPTTSSAGWRRPASPAGSASRPSRTSACAWASCRSPACRCRSCRTAGRRCSPACSRSACSRTSTCGPRRRSPTRFLASPRVLASR